MSILNKSVKKCKQKYGHRSSIRLNPMKSRPEELSTRNLSAETSGFQLRESSFSVSKLPPIPETPFELEVLLKSFSSSRSQWNEEDRRKVSKKRQKAIMRKNENGRQRTKLNGFMAYRAYHSRHILGIKNQRGLSIAIADVWKSDKCQIVWTRYAQEYNACNSRLPFVEWLLNQNHIELELDRERREWEETIKSKGRVENLCLNDKGQLITTMDAFNDPFSSMSVISSDPSFTLLMELNPKFPVDPIIVNIRSSSDYLREGREGQEI